MGGAARETLAQFSCLPPSLPPLLPSFSRQSPRDCFMAVLSIEIEGISDEGLGGLDVEG